MGKISFDSDRCKGCGLCVAACPKHLITIDSEQINQKGHWPAVIKDPAACTGCACCAIMCPDCVIRVER